MGSLSRSYILFYNILYGKKENFDCLVGLGVFVSRKICINSDKLGNQMCIGGEADYFISMNMNVVEK